MIGTRLGKFEITARLGQGGMGVVYEALEVELGRKVALKMLPAETANDPRRLERFRREARAVASLNHPNIVTIYGIEVAGDKHLLVMERIDGESLDKRIPVGGMSQSAIFDIAIPVAEALAAAHAGGVVHRDIKPANVMITRDGHVKVLDFGLAKMAAPDAAAEGSPTQIATRTSVLTGEGVVIGTPPYMSPEQLQGGEVDDRSDIFSLGVVLYEMATGKRPFQGRSGIEVASSILKDSPTSPSDVREDLPRHLGRIIEQCLEKDPDRRFQTIRDVRNQLVSLRRETDSQVSQPSVPAVPPATPAKRAWILAAAAVLVLGLGGIALWRAIGPDSHPASEETAAVAGPDRIVVLPFENLGSPDDEYFTDGMTDEITSRLAATDGLSVISRTSAMQFKGTRPSLDEIADLLNVAYVLEGTVRWQRLPDGTSRVRVTPRLVQVAEKTPLWTQQYNAVLADIFEVQSEIAERVSDELGVALLASGGAPRRPTESLEAYDAYLRGNDYYNRGAELISTDDFLIAVQMFEEAVGLDPDFAEAQARLSLTQISLYSHSLTGFGDRDLERLVVARNAAARALELDPNLALAHHARGELYRVDERDPERAMEEYRLALEIQPSNAEVYESIAEAQSELGLWEEGLASMRKAMELSPRLGRMPCGTGGFCWALRRFDEAKQLHDRAIRLTPDRACPYYCQVQIQLQRDGDTERARAICEAIPPNVGLEEAPPINFPWVEIEVIEGNYEAALKRLASGPAEAYSFGLYFIPKDLIAAEIQELLDHPDLARSHFEAARQDLEAGVQARPDDDAMRGSLGVVYAGLGRTDDAIREGELALDLIGSSRGDHLGHRLRDLAEIHLRVGDTEQAIDYLERLLSIPAFFSASYIRIDPTWRTLRDHPRFRALLEQHGA